MAARDAAKTRTRILDASEALILASGFTATSIEDIIARVGVTKGAFFYHFASKRELAQALIERFSRADLDTLHNNIERAEKLARDPLQQMLIFVGLFIEVADGLTEPYPGCLFATFIYESGQFDASLLEVAARNILEWRRVLGDKLREVASEHRPRGAVELDSLADLFTSIAEGSYVLSRVLVEPGLFAAQLRHYRSYLEHVFGQP